MKRVAEPDLMDDDEQARAYAMADFAEPHNAFIEEFRTCFNDIKPGSRVLDLGCGAADISIRFASAFAGCEIHGVDGAGAMLKYGHEAINQAGLSHRIQLVQGYFPQAQLPLEQYDVIICNSLLHHLMDPMVMWQSLKTYGGNGSQVFVMDLMRPQDEATAAKLLEQYAADEAGILRHDFYHSLLAAYEVDEVREQLQQAGLQQLAIRVISDRHFCVHGTL